MSELQFAVVETELLTRIWMRLEDVAEDPSRLQRAQELVTKDVHEILEAHYGPTSA